MYGTDEACPTAATMYSYTAGCGVQLLLPCTEWLKLEGMEPTSVAQHCRACAHHCVQATTLDEPLEFILPLLAYMGQGMNYTNSPHHSYVGESWCVWDTTDSSSSIRLNLFRLILAAPNTVEQLQFLSLEVDPIIADKFAAVIK